MNRAETLGGVAIFALMTQLVSATFLVRAYDSPNAASSIARSLAQRSEFFDEATNSRAFHLPGEPLYLAAGFRVFPESMWPYLHVPVVVLLVTSAASIAFAVGGPTLALTVGGVFSLEPFILAHGPVWDDVVLATALEWTIFAILISATEKAWLERSAGLRAAIMIGILICAGWGAVTRLYSQVLLGSVAVAAIAMPRLRILRQLGWAMAFGIVIALAAWGFRNLSVLGHFFIGSSHDGKTLEESIGPFARDAILDIGRAGGSSDLQPDPADELLSDWRLKQAAWHYLAANPVDVSKTALLKVAVTLSGLDLDKALTAPRNLIAFVSSVVLLVAGPWGLWSLYRPSPQTPAVLFLTLLFAASAVLTMIVLAAGPVGLRYRLGLSTFLCFGTAATLVRVSTWKRAGR